MTCPSCRNLMCDEKERYLCPTCRGELFPASSTAGLDESWFRSMQLYTAAMRDEKESYRVARKYGYIRKRGVDREEWDTNLGFI